MQQAELLDHFTIWEEGCSPCSYKSTTFTFQLTFFLLPRPFGRVGFTFNMLCQDHLVVYGLKTCFHKDVYMVNQNYSCCLHHVFINYQSMIEKYLLLTMQMSSASLTCTIFMSWTGFCCSIICIARFAHLLPHGQALYYFSRTTPQNVEEFSCIIQNQ